MASRISRPTGEASPATLPASTIGPLSDVVRSRPTVAVSSSAARFTRARAVSSFCSYAATTVRANSASRTGGRLFTVRIKSSRSTSYPSRNAIACSSRSGRIACTTDCPSRPSGSPRSSASSTLRTASRPSQNPDPSSPSSQPCPSAVRTSWWLRIRPALLPVPAISTVPSGSAVPEAKATSRSPMKSGLMVRPTPDQAASNWAATSGRASAEPPATPTTAALTAVGSSPASAA